MPIRVSSLPIDPHQGFVKILLVQSILSCVLNLKILFVQLLLSLLLQCLDFLIVLFLQRPELSVDRKILHSDVRFQHLNLIQESPILVALEQHMGCIAIIKSGGCLCAASVHVKIFCHSLPPLQSTDIVVGHNFNTVVS